MLSRAIIATVLPIEPIAESRFLSARFCNV